MAAQIIQAVEDGNLDELAALLDQGVNIETRSVDYQRTLLHIAVWNGHVNCVQLLLDRGAKVDAVDIERMTPLHFASAWEYLDIAKLLVSHKANLEAIDDNRWTPLHHCANAGSAACFKFLTEAGADLSAKNRQKESVEKVIEQTDYEEIKCYLEQRKLDALVRIDRAESSFAF